MENWKSSDEILDFAISEEEGAVKFYTELAEKATTGAMKRDLLLFAEEERSHKVKLVAVKEGRKFQPGNEEVLDLKIAEYIVDMNPDDVETYEDALVVAMKKEKAAYRLYTKLSEVVESEEARDLFKSLAQEEAKHKLRFETAFDDLLTEN